MEPTGQSARDTIKKISVLKAILLQIFPETFLVCFWKNFLKISHFSPSPFTSLLFPYYLSFTRISDLLSIGLPSNLEILSFLKYFSYSQRVSRCFFLIMNIMIKVSLQNSHILEDSFAKHDSTPVLSGFNLQEVPRNLLVA